MCAGEKGAKSVAAGVGAGASVGSGADTALLFALVVVTVLGAALLRRVLVPLELVLLREEGEAAAAASLALRFWPLMGRGAAATSSAWGREKSVARAGETMKRVEQ